MMNKTAFTVGLLALLLSVPAFAGSVNKNISIGAGEQADGASSVNGSISIGDNARVTGDVSTVNGSIHVDSGAELSTVSTVNGGVRIADNVRAEDVETVNGTIRVGDGCTVDGHVEAVNGRISVGNGSTITDDIENVNGEIELDGAQLNGDISTVSGDIHLAGQSRVGGDIVIEKPGGWGKSFKRKPRVVIGPGSTVNGVIDAEHEVELFISDTASVGGVRGVMSLDDAVRFSGDTP